MAPENQKAEATIQLRVDKELVNQAKILADKKGMSVSALMRYLLISELEKSKIRK